MAECLRQVALQSLIGGALVCMRPQVVAEQQVALDLRVIVGEQVRLMGSRRPAHEVMPAGDAMLAAIAIAERLEWSDAAETASNRRTTGSRSMIGFAARPGIAVLPM